MEIEDTTFGTITIRNWSFGSGGNGLGLLQVIAASGAPALRRANVRNASCHR